MKELSQVKAKISEYVTLGDILKKEGRISLSLSEEQLKCPFHGKDYKPSARYYKSTDSMYCWYCKKSWDIYKYISQRDNLNFKDTLNYILKFFNIDISSLPNVMDPENIRKKNEKRKEISYDKKIFFIEKVKHAIKGLQNNLEFDKYKRLVFAYLLLKFNTEEDKFLSDAQKINDVLVRLTSRG